MAGDDDDRPEEMPFTRLEPGAAGRDGWWAWVLELDPFAPAVGRGARVDGRWAGEPAEGVSEHVTPEHGTADHRAAEDGRTPGGASGDAPGPDGGTAGGTPAQG